MTTVITWGLVSILGSSFAVCALLILTQKWHGALSLDHDLIGAQKIHQAPVPRVGGLALMISLCVGALVGYLMGGKTYPIALQLLACATPVFLAGFAEDLTKAVSVRTRLYASFVSAALAIWVLDAQLLKLDTPILDTLIHYPAISALFTIFAVGGVTHSINIIDGLNGLAAGAASIILAGIGALAWIYGDIMILKLCLWGIAALIGFLLLNYPFGRIFLGDGGAYLAGFWVAECAVLLLMRNPKISTWAVLLACLYPVWETVFSMYRRHMIQRVASGRPDMAHMHQLLFNRTQNQESTLPNWLKHGLSSCALWAPVIACQAAAIWIVASGLSDVIPTVCVALFGLLYIFIYRNLANANVSIGNSEATPLQAN